jgi:hypothetical protein
MWSRILAFLGAIGSLYRASPLIAELRDDHHNLSELNTWFLRQRPQVRMKIFYENRRYAFTFIVDKSSAIINDRDVDPVPSDADHFDLCKLPTREDWIYADICNFLADVFRTSRPRLPRRLPENLLNHDELRERGQSMRVFALILFLVLFISLVAWYAFPTYHPFWEYG